MSKDVKIAIVGDAKSAIAAFKATEAASMGMGKAVLASSALVAGAAVGIGVALFKVGESFDSAYDKIRVGTGATEAELEGLKDVFRGVVADVPTDFGKAADAITLVAQRLDLTGPALEAMSEQFLELSRITETDVTGNIEAVTGVFKLFGVAAEDQGAKLDVLFRAQQNTGVGVAQLASQMAAAGTQLQALGFSFDSATVMVAGLGKAGLDVADIMPSLSKVMAVGAKEGKSAQEVWFGLNRAIREAPDDVAAAEIAFDALGAKAGPKFAALIRSGQLGFDSLGETILDGTDTIMKAGKETQDFGEKWTIFKNRVLLALEPVAMRVFDGMGQLMDKLSPIVDELGKAFGEEGLAGAFRVLAGHFDNLSPKVQAITIAVAAFGAALFVATFPMQSVILGLAGLAAGLIYAYNHSETFRNVVDSVASFLTGTLWPALQSVGSYLAATFTEAVNSVTTAWNAGAAAVSAVTTVVTDLWNNQLAPLASFLSAAFTASVNAASAAIDVIRGAFSTFATVAGNLYGNTLGPIVSALERIISLAGQAASAVGKIPGVGGGGGGGLLGSITRNIPGGQLLHLGENAMGGPVSAGGATWVGEQGPEIFVPGRNGTIIPNHALGGGGDIYVTVNFRGSSLGTPSDVIAAVNEGVRKGIKLQTTPG